jgi:hypothetical protein
MLSLLTFMATEQILTLLILERDKLNRAIEALGAPVKRRGRPQKASKPAVATPVVATAVAVKKRKPMTAAQKKLLSQKMKAAWAKRRKQANG